MKVRLLIGIILVFGMAMDLKQCGGGGEAQNQVQEIQGTLKTISEQLKKLEAKSKDIAADSDLTKERMDQIMRVEMDQRATIEQLRADILDLQTRAGAPASVPTRKRR